MLKHGQEGLVKENHYEHQPTLLVSDHQALELGQFLTQSREVAHTLRMCHWSKLVQLAKATTQRSNLQVILKLQTFDSILKGFKHTVFGKLVVIYQSAICSDSSSLLSICGWYLHALFVTLAKENHRYILKHPTNELRLWRLPHQHWCHRNH